MKKEFYDALIQLTEEKNVLTDEPLKNHVTFRVGGRLFSYAKRQECHIIF